MRHARSLIRLLSWVNLVQLRCFAAISVALVAVIAVVIALGVFFRYVLNDSLSWAEELAKYAMLWLVFTAAPIALRLGMHPGIDMLSTRFPGRVEQVLKAIVSLGIAAFCGFLAIKGHQFAWNGKTQVAISIGDLSMYWIFVSIPLGMLSMALIGLQQFLEHLVAAVLGTTPEPDPFSVRMQHVMDEQA